MIRFVDVERPRAAKPRPAARIMAGLRDAIAFANGDETRGRLVIPDPARLATVRKAFAESKARRQKAKAKA